ncbi:MULTISPECIES: isochorismatase family protein [unclassified Streptomyces]|uniref:isochorismatase family protein n=1 Tax=unclassified Streptomyces TaxID=2593676 RepID=UPI001CA73E11|nr:MULTISPECIES: isochorismatase family protein [unclassified Streptomyces]
MTGIPNIEPYPLPTSAELSKNVADWTVDPQRGALLIHDMQRYFLRPFPETMTRQLVRNTVSVRDRCRDLGMPVAYTMQPGAMNPSQRGLLADFWGAGMETAPVDRDVPEPLTPGPLDGVFTKWRYSAFFRTELLAWLRRHGADQLVICGVYAHVGVLASAVDAFSNDVQPFVVADAVADFSARDHRFALEYAARKCAVVVTAEDVLP